MTQGEVKVFEAEMVLLPVKSKLENKPETADSETVEIKKNTLKLDIDKRFARLGKSIRKRSASIF